MNKPEYQSQNETKLSNMPPRPHQAKGKKKVNPAVVGGAVAGAAVLGVGGTAAAMSLSDDDNEEELPEEDILDLDSQEEEIVIGDGSGAGNGESIISHIFGGESADSPAATSAQAANGPSSQAAPHRPQQSHHHQHQPQAQQHQPQQQEQHQQTQQPQQQQQQQQQHQEQHQQDNTHTPDDVDVNEVISVTEVDNNDNDMPELLAFEEPVYQTGPGGNVQVSANFTLEGENYTMIDVDNDGVFDGVVCDGQVISTETGGMMVSDVELMVNESNDDYLAATETDNNDDVSLTGDVAADDTILV